MLRRYPHLAALERPNGETGTYTPLTPATWHCASIGTESSGALLLAGRYHATVHVGDRLRLKGRRYHVDSVLNVGERDVDLQIICHEVFDA